MMTGRFISLEKIIRRAPLALRFVDLLLDKPISDGLEAQAFRLRNGAVVRETPPVTAQRSLQSGIYGFQHLDGLRDYELDRRPLTDFCPDEAAEPNYLITVRDRLRRYQPVLMALCLPQPHVVAVDLFSTGDRLVPDTFGVVRVQLWDSEAEAPAAWALVQVTLAGGDFIGLADDRGMVAVHVPYPPLPEGGPNPILWDVTLQVFYRPADSLEFVSVPGQEGLPPLLTSVRRQLDFPPALLLQSDFEDQPAVETDRLDGKLEYRTDWIVKTAGNDADNRPFSRLVLRPAP